MDYKKQYEIWVSKSLDDKDLEKELLDIKNDDEKIKESFFKNLEFGTGGLRGILGVGTNRINIYTVRKATQGFCNYLKEKNSDIAVAISFDSRNKSELFSKECARVLAANGVKSIITDKLMPTPFLSFLVRRFNCNAGIMITASHNPFIYNGYKAYDQNGCQLTDIPAKNVIECVNKLDVFNDVKIIPFDEGVNNGLIDIVSDDVYNEYIDEVLDKDLTKNVTDNNNVKVVYTPLNGAGNIPFTTMLRKIGCTNFSVVKEQEKPDGNFPTCTYPNPEEKEALKLSLELGDKENADLILATDPDSDRLGVCVKNKNGEYRILTGNEIGILILDYIINERKKQNIMPKEPVVVKTIVSSKLIDKMCEKNNIQCINVLTGFKYIGEQIEILKQNGVEKNFVFGYEESFGYLTDGFVRDKDAVLAGMHLVKMSNAYIKKNNSLLDRLEEIYKEYGYIQNKQISHSFLGLDGLKKMQDIMENLRNNFNNIDVNGYDIIKVNDYLLRKSTDLLNNVVYNIDLPSSNVIEIIMNKGASIIIRPSGTEPKIKAYICANGELLDENKKVVDDMLKVVSDIFE